MEQGQQPNKVLIGIVVAAVLSILAAGAWYSMNNSSTTNVVGMSAQPDTVNMKMNNSNDDTTKITTFIAGEYSATGFYQSPGGSEEVKVTVTLATDGTIESSQVTPLAASGTSQQYQSDFVNNYESMVVGRNINEVELSRVAGSSLTSIGFNDALDQITEDAKG